MLRYHFLQVFMLFPACLIFMLPLQRMSGFWKRYLASIVISVIIAVPFSLYVLSFPIDTPIWNSYWILRPLLAFALTLLIIKLSIKLPWGEAIYYSIWTYLTRELGYHFSIVVSRYLVPNGWLFDMSYFMITLVCHVLIYLVIYLSIARNLPLEGHIFHFRGQLSLSVLLASSVTVIKPYTIFVQNASTEYDIFFLIESASTLFVIIALYAQYAAEKQIGLERELAMQKQLWVQHEKQMESTKRNAELLNTKYHDLKHYIAALRVQKNVQNRNQVLDELEASVRAFDSAVHTGNETLDAVLTEKSLYCQDMKVVLTCVADGTLLRGMAAVDLYVMLGNVLDNAIECVTGLEDVQRRIISVAIFRVQDMVKIQIENPYDIEPVFQNDLPVTTKADKSSHGFGVKSIKTVAERYGGYVTATAEDGLFTLHILLPMAMVAE